MKKVHYLTIIILIILCLISLIMFSFTNMSVNFAYTQLFYSTIVNVFIIAGFGHFLSFLLIEFFKKNCIFIIHN